MQIDVDAVGARDDGETSVAVDLERAAESAGNGPWHSLLITTGEVVADDPGAITVVSNRVDRAIRNRPVASMRR